MASTDQNKSKSALRTQYRDARLGLDALTRVRLDRDIRNHIRHAPRFQQARHVGAYWAIDGEPDLRPLLERSLARGMAIALPVVKERGGMVFRDWRPGAPLEVNRYAIPEPAAGAEPSLEELDLILLPLVAWDRGGRRLGAGGGYYDRMFRKHRDTTRPLRVGVAYGVQESRTLPVEAWDIPLHAVVTEQGWFTCPS